MEAGRRLVENVFGQERVLTFVDNVTDFWTFIAEIPNLDTCRTNVVKLRRISYVVR